MIKIEERIQQKIPGKTTLFVSFPYSKELVDIIKTCTPCNYDKKSFTWEIPTTRLSKFVNMARSYDSVELSLMKPKISKPDKDFDIGPFKTTPYKYQVEGIQYGLNHDNWLLLDAPGLGKTLQMICLAEERKKRNNIEHCLIVCGLNTLKTNWEKEIHKHSNLDCVILGKKVNRKGKVYYGSIADRLEQLKQPIKEFFVIMNVETLRDKKILAELKKGINKFDMVVFDELHVCKSNTSQQGKNLLAFTSAKYKVGLTGTPILNNPTDAYVPLKWIGEEKASASNFRYQYCEYGGPFGNEFIQYKNIDVLKEQLSSCSLRRTKDLLDLPPKTIIDEFLDMSDKQQTFYDNIVAGVVDEVDKVTIRTTNLLALVARLRQATACPSILTTEQIPSVKLDRCHELVEELVASGNKVVVFSTFKQTLYELEQRLAGYSPLLCTGDITDDVISANIDAFQTDPSKTVMLATHQKMGTGHTLTAASYAIFIDTPFTEGAFQQACDRIHRIGSKDPVFIYNLICNQSFDERVHSIVQGKAAVSDYIVDDKLDERTLDLLRKYIKELV